ncbi:RecBCD enzyme subunit RecC [Desulforhopalus sp. 52FAK]
MAQGLADAFTSFCNFKFFLPLDFLSSIADRLGIGISPDGFNRQTLTFRLDQLLREIDGDEYSQIQYYLEGERRNLKRFQLARRLANVFDQYQLMRSDMLESWERGVLTTDHISEPWQMALWQRLIEQPGGEVHRGMQLHSVIEALETAGELSATLPKRISVIGLHTMPPLFLSFLNGLARHMDVHFFLLSPCRQYWGDVETKRQQYKKMIKSGVPVTVEVSSEHHPLLASLGRQGKDLQAMMLEGADFALEFESYEDPLEAEKYTNAPLLKKLQYDLLEGRQKESGNIKYLEDNSIQIVSCHSKVRELTVLREQLLYLLHTDPDLELRDIIVMAPDIQEYAPLIPAVFKSLQHSIADRSVRRRNSVFAGFFGFIQLFSGRFGWSEVLDILRQPSIFPQFDLSLADFDQIESWVVESGVRWGLSAEQRGEDGLVPFAENSWRAGLDRMLMGFACGQDSFVDGVLPFTELEGRGAAPLGGLCRFVDLLDGARVEFGLERSLSDWSELLLGYVAVLFGEESEKELIELRMLLDDLGGALDGFPEAEVSFEVIREWFEQSAKEKRTSSGFLRGQLTFCSMLPMRSIPFEVVCLLGLNDGVYPTPDSHDNFDLMGESGEFRLGDRSSRADDRYQFLEAILAARRNLYLSYVGQSAHTNEEIPPSVVLTELIEVLAEDYGAENLVVSHPLHNFSSKYFEVGAGNRFVSYDGASCKVAERLREELTEPAPWWQGELEPPVATVDTKQLLLFFNNPQKYFVRHCLGVQLARLEELPEDRELFELTGLGRYHMDQALIEQALNNPGERNSEDDFLKKEQVSGGWPLGASGALSYSSKKREISRFIEQITAQDMGEKCSAMHVDCVVGEYQLQGPLDNVFENGILIARYGALRGRDLLLAWLHHLILQEQKGDTESNTCLVTTEKAYRFSKDSTGPDLITMLDIFRHGQTKPSELFIEPAFVYARQIGGWGTIDPLDKAKKALRDSLAKGYEPEWQLLLDGQSEDELLGESFEDIVVKVMVPLMEEIDG